MRYKIVNIRQLRVCDPTPLTTKPKISHARDVVAVLQAFFASTQNDQEKVVIVPLSNNLNVMGFHVVHEGSMDCSVVSIPAVLRHVLVSGAEQFICAHNHPSGTIQPSQEDCKIANTLHQASKLCSLRMLDFIIIGDGTENYYSFSDERKL